MTEDDILDDVLRREAGWVDRADDHGGPTNRGITLSTYRWRFGAGATIEDLRGLTEEGARAIYRALYIHGPGFDQLQDPVLRALVVDSGVHSGQGNATRFLQRALEVKDDGQLGPKSLAAIAGWDRDELFDRVLAERMEFLGRLISHDLRDNDHDGIPDNAENASGWQNRLGGILRSRAGQRRVV